MSQLWHKFGKVRVIKIRLVYESQIKKRLKIALFPICQTGQRNEYTECHDKRDFLGDMVMNDRKISFPGCGMRRPNHGLLLALWNRKYGLARELSI